MGDNDRYCSVEESLKVSLKQIHLIKKMVVYIRNHGKNFVLRLIRRTVMKKPINRAFIIAEDKSEKFKNEKKVVN